MVDYGIQIEPQFGFTLSDILEITTTGQENGFSTLWFSDHFMLDANATSRVLLDPWLLMTALVRENKEIRIGSLVFCNSYRPPALHAKMGATLDVLSEGRLEFGIGAGWKEIEYNAYGYEFPRDLVRIEQLAEAIQIIKGIWAEDKFSFSGEHYTLQDLVSFPKPLQKPRPTIWIGTMYGKRRMLELTAKYGDGINLAWSFSVEQLTEIFSQLDTLTREVGRDPSEVKRSIGFWTRIFDDENQMETAIIEGARKRDVSVEKYRERISSSFWGTPDTLREKLKEYIDLGVSHFIFMFPHQEECVQIKKTKDILIQ